METIEASWPWLKAYPTGIDWRARFPEQPLYQFLEDSVARFGDRPCLDFLGRSYSYAEIGRLVRRAAKGFAALGVHRGVRVGLMLPNTPYYVIAYYAVLEAGGIVVNFNPLYAPPEIRRFVEDAEVAIMVTLDLKQLYAPLAPLLGKAGVRQSVPCAMADVLPFGKAALYPPLRRRATMQVPPDRAHIRFRALLA